METEIESGVGDWTSTTTVYLMGPGDAAGHASTNSVHATVSEYGW